MHTVAWDYAYADAMPMPAAYRVMGVVGLSLVLGVIFLVDRQVARGFKGFVTTLHARMATMRSIEQEFSLVRPTEEGISLVTDPLGRTLAWQDTDRLEVDDKTVAKAARWPRRTLSDY